MPRRIALIGHCGPDSMGLRHAVLAVSGEDAQVVSVDSDDELREFLKEPADLLLINRLLEWGFKENHGVELIRHLHKGHPKSKVMLISNLPDAQKAAVEAGAVQGFGKAELGEAKVRQCLQAALK